MAVNSPALKPRYLLTLIPLSLLLQSCGGSKHVGRHPSGESTAPAFEHELLTTDEKEGNWEVTDHTEDATRHDKLYLQDFIDAWYGTPHVMGGNTKKGVDCSGFVIQCYLQVYDDNFKGRRAEDLFAEVKPLRREELQEGDLVFFKINGRRIDHVGLYLAEGNFVHVSSSRGVMVSSLDEPYFSKRFFKGGRKK